MYVWIITSEGTGNSDGSFELEFLKKEFTVPRWENLKGTGDYIVKLKEKKLEEVAKALAFHLRLHKAHKEAIYNWLWRAGPCDVLLVPRKEYRVRGVPQDTQTDDIALVMCDDEYQPKISRVVIEKVVKEEIKTKVQDLPAHTKKVVKASKKYK